MSEIAVYDEALAAAIEKIWKKYARLTKAGKPIRCRPSKVEINQPFQRVMPEGTDGKIIYDTRQNAQLAANEFFRLTRTFQSPYRCRRSRSGHYHLHTDHKETLKKKIKALREQQKGNRR